jgi:hypothetical protein
VDDYVVKTPLNWSKLLQKLDIPAPIPRPQRIRTFQIRLRHGAVPSSQMLTNVPIKKDLDYNGRVDRVNLFKF